MYPHCYTIAAPTQTLESDTLPKQMVLKIDMGTRVCSSLLYEHIRRRCQLAHQTVCNLGNRARPLHCSTIPIYPPAPMHAVSGICTTNRVMITKGCMINTCNSNLRHTYSIERYICILQNKAIIPKSYYLITT